MEDVWAGIVSRIPQDRIDMLLAWSATSHAMLGECMKELARRALEDPMVLFEVCALGHTVGLLACAETLCDETIEGDPEFDFCNLPSLLEWAIRHGRDRIVQTLIYDLEVTVSNDQGAFFAAIAVCDSPDLLDLMVRHGYVKIDFPWKGRTPLYEAVERGRVQAARFLVKEGANPSRHSLRLRTPLTLAVHLEDLDILKVFVEFGCDLSAPDTAGQTALHRAAYTGNADIIKYLLDHGACVNLPDQDTGRTPLHCARTVDAIATLVNAGASLTATTLEGATPLHAVVDRFRVRIRDLESLVHFMICQGVSLDLCNEWQPKTPLCLAIEHCHRDAVELLLKQGADANKPLATSKKTPMHLAIEMQAWEIVRVLVDNGADVDAGSPLTPLYYAVLECNVKAVKLLIRTYTAHVPAKIVMDAAYVADADTFRALLEAKTEGIKDLRAQIAMAALGRIRRGGDKILKVLIAHFPDMINEPLDTYGRTALHCVVCQLITDTVVLATSSSRRLVSWLLRKGADPHAPDEEGKTPRDYAKFEADIRKLLDRHTS